MDLEIFSKGGGDHLAENVFLLKMIPKGMG